MKAVKFLQNKAPYTVGDVAGVEDQQADEYVREGIAEYIGENKSTDVQKPAKDKAVKSPRKKAK